MVLAPSRRWRSRECLVDVLDHWCGRTSEEPVGHHQIQGLQSRFKGLHRQRRDGLLHGRHEVLHRRRRGSVLVVAARGAIPSCTVAATKVDTFNVATSVETTTDACTAEAAMTKTAYSTTAASDESVVTILIFEMQSMLLPMSSRGSRIGSDSPILSISRSSSLA